MIRRSQYPTTQHRRPNYVAPVRPFPNYFGHLYNLHFITLNKAYVLRNTHMSCPPQCDMITTQAYIQIQYNTKFVKRHVAVASEALANRTVKKHRRRRTNVL